MVAYKVAIQATFPSAERAQLAYNSSPSKADIADINHDTEVPFSTWPIKEAQGDADVKVYIGDISD